MQQISAEPQQKKAGCSLYSDSLAIYGTPSSLLCRSARIKITDTDEVAVQKCGVFMDVDGELLELLQSDEVKTHTARMYQPNLEICVCIIRKSYVTDASLMCSG